MAILLIYPPTAKICEPPAGIARLAGSLRGKNISCCTGDLNLECMLDIFATDNPVSDTWSRRAYKNRYKNLDELRLETIYGQPDRYQRAVKDINRVVSNFGTAAGHDISLANFNSPDLSPLQSTELLKAAELFDQNPFYSSFRSRIDELLGKGCFDFIGISLSYLSQALTTFAILGYIRKVQPDIKTVLGGGLVTSWMSNPGWKNRFTHFVDHFIDGPGEQPLLELMGVESDTTTGRPEYNDFDFPRYLAPGPIIPYAASDGCYWKKCTFCPDHAENNCYTQNSPERVSNEISTLVARHHPVLLHFLDNAISPVILGQLVKDPPGVPWYGFTRFEHELEDPDFCYDLKKSGCVLLKLGLESGSQKVLDQMHKGIELTRAARVLTNLERAGIATYVYLLFGTPHETEKEAVQTMDFVRMHHRSITFLNLAIFNMPVCSHEARGISNRFSDGDLSLYCNFTHPHGWDRKSIRQFLHTRFRKEPLISKIIQHDPAFFTSNHAPLLCMNE